ncbi:methylenetetrahydrofolate reductase [Candidatus Bipolaricaulota bacterium]|nr:methylenetetrahydrofolate reductase [Candidatus Bipolaricaulota bacterium]
MLESEPVITCEAGPPKGTDIDDLLEELDEIAEFVNAFNVTDQQSSVMRVGSLAVSHRIEKLGHETVYQLTCRDRNRIALQSDLLSANVLGIKNVLALTGDYTTLGDHPHAKPVFDLDSPQLLAAIRDLNQGKDIGGNELEGATELFPGAAVNPGADPVEPQVHKAKMKADLGAKFFQSQAVYDPPLFKDFMEKLRKAGVEVPVLVGILPLKSAGMARFMNENIAGAYVPTEVIEELESSSNTVKKSLEICSRVIDKTGEFCEGLHLMPMGWEEHVPEILEMSGQALSGRDRENR